MATIEKEQAASTVQGRYDSNGNYTVDGVKVGLLEGIGIESAKVLVIKTESIPNEVLISNPAELSCRGISARSLLGLLGLYAAHDKTVAITVKAHDGTDPKSIAEMYARAIQSPTQYVSFPEGERQ